MQRPVPPVPPPCRVECACGKTIPEDVWLAKHQHCRQRVLRFANFVVVLIILEVLALALVANPTIPWPWNP
jgi:hypothetical protein